MKKTKKPKSHFVLKSWDGKYFRVMTLIGPCLTAELSEAYQFASREGAAFSPAANHALCLFTVEEIQPSHDPGPTVRALNLWQPETKE